MQRNIHIKAICPYFEIYELVAEDKAVERLKKIKKMYEWGRSHNQQVVPKKSKSRIEWMLPYEMDNENKLSVTTGVHNPELPFKYPNK